MDLLSLEQRLIGFDTVSSRANLALAGFLEDLLHQLGLRAETLPTDEPGKANVHAVLGPQESGGLMLAGHMDVVPTEGQDWSSDPFQLQQRDGRLYGRGTADMKTFLAHAALAATEFRNRRLRKPIHLAFTCDEEIGCGGARHLMEVFQQRHWPMPACALLGEPTGFEVFRMHKGFRHLRIDVRGVEGHSSKPQRGANAIIAAGRLLTHMAQIAHECTQRRTQEEDFEVPWSTVSVGRIQGGTALNIIPNQCMLDLEYRCMPTEDPEYIQHQIQGYVDEVLRPAFQQEHPQADVHVRTVLVGEPMLTPPGSLLEPLLLELTAQPRTKAAPYYTEGAIYNAAGISTLICGPGDINQAHRPDEYIAQDQFERGVPFLCQLIERFCL